MKTNCPNCKVETNDHDYCWNCGYEFEKLTCPLCGKVHPRKYSHCPVKGGNIEEEWKRFTQRLNMEGMP